MTDRSIWERYYSAPGAVDYEHRDPMSEAVHRVLADALGPARGRLVCEAGAGSGKISLWLAQAGAQVVLVDFAFAPLALSRQAFLERGVAGEFVQADVRAMPLPAGRFDLTWNAGVLEHADPDAQAAMLREMARVTRPGGQVVTINPHARCVPYQLGKYWALRTGRWPYGDERPLFSHRQLFAAADLALEDEFSIGADVGFDFLRFIPVLGPPLREIARAWWSELSCADRRQMPGYLLVGVARI